MWLTAVPDTARLLVVAVVLTMPTVFISVPMITEVVPRRMRATGPAVVYGLGVSVCGGTHTVRRDMAHWRDRRHARAGRLRY
ncbi:hypothetical protein DRB87_06330 [Pandoraea sp. XY-2]|nr:hypothetical protein DRB87_06330 [Pandoraea sp. XY-2]